MKYFIFYIMVSFCFCACDGFNLTDQSNETIPNYSITLNNLLVDPDMESKTITINDNNLITAIENNNHEIIIYSISQNYSNENWQLSTVQELFVADGKLMFFDTLQSKYVIGYLHRAGQMTIEVKDQNFNTLSKNESLERFIDTTYNGIDSLKLNSYFYCDASNELLLGGEVFTQNTSYSCMMGLNLNLDPLWFKTYFEEANISGLTCINADTILMLNQNSAGTDLIRDNFSSSAYQKYDLNSDDLFSSSQLIFNDGFLFIIGVQNDIARILEVNVDQLSAFINEVEIYPINEIKGLYLSRNQLVIAGIQTIGTSNSQFASELESLGSMWCHRYVDEYYIKILDVIEMPGKGIVVTSIVERNGAYYLHLTRIDEEGATFIDEYTENCI